MNEAEHRTAVTWCLLCGRQWAPSADTRCPEEALGVGAWAAPPTGAKGRSSDVLGRTDNDTFSHTKGSMPRLTALKIIMSSKKSTHEMSRQANPQRKAVDCWLSGAGAGWGQWNGEWLPNGNGGLHDEKVLALDSSDSCTTLICA